MDHIPCEENLKKQLALAIRNIQWSYAIFWSPSPNDSGVLQWGDGCYNGGIKTRKTILSMDLKANDQTISQRSEQLRELYHSLLAAATTTTTTQTRRPLAALSPEDLTNVEWFYLVCMSFVFNIGQGLPGTSMESGRTIWLTNAHLLDTGLFTRSLLAKSAGVKTVVCFPFLDGVIELGVTELVEDDLNIIQHVRALLLEDPSSTPHAFAPSSQGLDIELMSLSGSSNGAELIQPLSELFLIEHLDGVMEDDQLSNCVNTSIVSSDQQGTISRLNCLTSEDSQHYQSALSSLFKKSDQGFLQQLEEQMDKKSNFVGWKKGSNEKTEFSEVTSQYMLKKILFEVPKMHSVHSIESKEDSVGKDELCKQEVPNTNHVLAERRRREKVNDRFSTLRSLIPSISKSDKISILDDTIAYLKELERRVEELESCQESTGFIVKKKRKTVDIEERTSDNYGNDINAGAKNKRKGRNVEDISTRDSLVENTIAVSMADQETLINISCPWRESLLIQIIDAMSNLHLDSQSVHSSTVDGILSLKIQSTLKGSNSVSVELITQTLLKVIRHK